MGKNIFWLEENKLGLPLDKSFIPAFLWNAYFKKKISESSKNIPIAIAIIKDSKSIMVYRTLIFSKESEFYKVNYYYIEKLIKTLLWLYGGYKIIIAGSKDIAEFISKAYSENGHRSFDASFMSKIYEKPFEVKLTKLEDIPSPKEKTEILGGFFNGCRIGFDLGVSDRKVSAVINGKTVFIEEVIWNPSVNKNPSYHYREIMSMLHKAAAHMPCVDAIGGSSAGIFIKNRVISSSIFKAIPKDIFDKKVKNFFLEIQKKWGVPLKVINDGKVAALSGSLSLKRNSILGIAMGSSEAGGYIDKKGKIESGLDELAFVPIDYNPNAPIDEWSKDTGCGVQYFSQIAAIRIAKKLNIEFEKDKSPSKNLKFLQNLMDEGDGRIIEIFKTIGCYLGYTIVYYTDFYDIENVFILGRVSSGKGGKIIIDEANRILKKEFKEIYKRINIFLPDEKTRRIGQAIAAASLPKLNDK
ncbi:MAG: ROK family protein [Actinobacteria bacterium]|nr:ROK family protein [Actinomycetota bacterium]